MQITTFGVMQQFGTFAFNTVRWWRKLGEVENECTSHIVGSFLIFLPKIIKIGGNLTKFWQKQICLVFFWDTVYILLIFINVQWVAPLCCISSIRTISNTEAPPGESQWKQVTACCSAWQRYALYRLPCTFYPNVTTLGSGLCYRKSVCHLFVCLSVTSVHPTQRVERWTFWQYFFTALTSVQNFTKIVPGEPLHRRR